MAESSKAQTNANGSAGTFTLVGEDYTLANSLRYLLNRNPHVDFCGFSAPHPSEDLINLRIQTTGRITAKQALKKAATDLKRMCEHIKQEYNAAVDEYVSGHDSLDDGVSPGSSEEDSDASMSG